MKIIMCIVLVFVCAFAVADAPSWLEVEWTFQAGWIPAGEIIFYTPDPKYNLLDPFNIVFKIDSTFFSFFMIGGDMTCDFNKTDSFDFAPTGMTYSFYSGISITKGFKIIFEHSCAHPVFAYLPTIHNKPNMDLFHNRLYIEIKSGISF